MSVPTATRPRVVAGLRLVALVGHGGEGEVWEARDPAGRRRALKLVRPAALAEDADLRIAYLRRIAHPALVRVHDGGVIGEGPLDGWGWMEMDFVDGEPLHAAAGEPDVLDRLWPLAEALDCLHDGLWSRGVPLVHRDVKPANLVGTPDGRLVLVDPSTLRGVDTTQLTRIGTPVFCAPEVMRGRIGPPADVYSFAVTAVALVTGARGAALADLLDEIESLDLPPGVRRALSSRPSDRPKSCEAVLDATVRFADEGGWHTIAMGPAAAPTDPAAAAEPTAGIESWDGAATGGVLVAEGGGRDVDLGDQGPPVAALPARVPLGWSTALAILVALVAAVVTGDLSPAEGLATATAVHLIAHLVARRSLVFALLLPPVAWAFLLTQRARGSLRRQAWLRAALTGALTTLTAVLVVPRIVQPGLVGLGAGSTAVLALLLGSGGSAVLALAGHAHGGWAGAMSRLLALPAWLLGAGLLIAGCILLLPFALLAGRTRALGRLLGRTIASTVETFRATP